MQMPARLSAVTLGAFDLPRLRRFYSGLGWVEIDGSDDEWAAYHVGGVMLALFPMAALAAEATAAPRSEQQWSGVTLACNVDSPDDVDRTVEAARAAGAVVVAEPTPREWGGRSAYIADPEGNRWEIAWARSATFDDRGALTGFGA